MNFSKIENLYHLASKNLFLQINPKDTFTSDTCIWTYMSSVRHTSLVTVYILIEMAIHLLHGYVYDIFRRFKFRINM